MPGSFPYTGVALVGWHYSRGLARLLCLRLYQLASLVEIYEEWNWFVARAWSIPRRIMRAERQASLFFDSVEDRLDFLWAEYRSWYLATGSLRSK